MAGGMCARKAAELTIKFRWRDPNLQVITLLQRNE